MPTLFNSATQYRQALEKRGFKELGHGYYSSVYGKDGADYVIKVCHEPTDMWPDYAAWCHDNPGPFRPLIRSLKWHNADASEDDYYRRPFYVAVIERLDCVLREAANNPKASSRTKEIFRIVDDGRGIDRQARAFDDADMPDVARFLWTLSEAFPDASSDLHTNNWMFRADGALILTDPFASGSSSQRRIKCDMRGYQYKLPLTLPLAA